MIGARLGKYTPWKVSLWAEKVSFLVSMLLHMGYVHFIKKRMVLTAHYRFVHRDIFQKIRTIPIVATSRESYEYRMNNLGHSLHQNSMILPMENDALEALRTQEMEGP